MDKDSSKHIPIPIFLCRALQVERNFRDELHQLTCSSNQPQMSLQVCLKDIQTSNATFPVSEVFDILLKKAKDDTEEKGEKKRKQERESPHRVSKRLKCNDSTQERNGVLKKTQLNAPDKTSRLSRTRRLKQQRNSVEVQETSTSLDSNRTRDDSDSDNTPEDVPWTDKYSPQCSSEVIGNDAAVRKLYSWLKKWKQRADSSEAKERNRNATTLWDSGAFQGEAGSDDLGQKPRHNLMLVTGPTGVGKTASVYACALELGFKVFEVNSSSQRSGRHVLAQLKEATQSHLVETSETDCLKPAYFSNFSNKNSTVKNDAPPAKAATTRSGISNVKHRPPLKFSSCKAKPPTLTLTSYFKTKAQADQLFFGHQDESTVGFTTEESDQKEKKRKATSLILFEEVDVVFEDDVGFYAAIKTFMATTKRPVVLISDDAKFKERFNCSLEEIIFKSTSTAHVSSYLQLVCLAEKVKLELDDAVSLVTLTRGDIRRCLLQLQLWTKGSNIDESLSPLRASCTASMLGLSPLTKTHLLEILQRWDKSDAKEVLALLAESWRRDVPLLYSNLDHLLPPKSCYKLQSRATSDRQAERRVVRLSRRRPAAIEPGLSTRRRSKTTTQSSEFFELMSDLDATAPTGSLCRPQELAWTRCEVKDGLLDELGVDPVGKRHRSAILEIKAAVEGLGFRGCWSRVWNEVRRNQPEQADKEWRKDKNLSFSFQPQSSISQIQKRDKISRTLYSKETFSLMGSSSRLAACVDCVPYLRFICRLRKSDKSGLNYLIDLGLPKSVIPALAADFFQDQLLRQHKCPH